MAYLAAASQIDGQRINSGGWQQHGQLLCRSSHLLRVVGCSIGSPQFSSNRPELMGAVSSGRRAISATSCTSVGRTELIYWRKWTSPKGCLPRNSGPLSPFARVQRRRRLLVSLRRLFVCFRSSLSDRSVINWPNHQHHQRPSIRVRINERHKRAALSARIVVLSGRPAAKLCGNTKWTRKLEADAVHFSACLSAGVFALRHFRTNPKDHYHNNVLADG